MTDSLDFSPLRKAIASLEIALAAPKDDLVRDATIQRFEYTYELCWKMLRRHLMGDIGSEEVDRLSRKDLFRVAADKGLLPDPVPWFAYHHARNETSHVYDEKKAEAVYAVAVNFLPDAQALLTSLGERHD